MGATAKHIEHSEKKVFRGKETGKVGSAVDQIIDLQNDPYFIRKAESAKRLIDKYGPPKK